MTDIRTRIATAIMQTCHGVYMDDAVNAADAVIRELGLREENIDGAVIKDWVGTPIRIRPPRYRYVTEWEQP